jgi:hypothetical protein
MPNDDPYDLERYWDRLRGPRPAADAPKARDDLADEKLPDLSGDVWAAALISVRPGEEPVYGRRFQITAKTVLPDGIEVPVHLPPAERDCTIHGVALWESATAVQPVAVARFEPTTILQGDSGDLIVKIEL